jgi:hypothetical protein
MEDRLHLARQNYCTHSRKLKENKGVKPPNQKKGHHCWWPYKVSSQKEHRWETLKFCSVTFPLA